MALYVAKGHQQLPIDWHNLREKVRVKEALIQWV